ncbi:DUF2793 domain-containing protein [uncultured Brevundimonas sp.]|uniref:DUF2793 domain-containing protein n=1 Tax=uncultured Brevundimonas sp. TaxID=213418 RepID=UPI002615D7BB|nr:DUF2793 domain-containing protein [uncultured Brevundimonas sp.]
MTDESGRLGLPYVMAGQLQKHVTVNEAMTRLDAMVQMAVISRSLANPPAQADVGALYIVPEAGNHGWTEFAGGTVVRREVGGWVAGPVTEGMLAVVLDEGVTLVRLSGQWQPLGAALGGALTLEALGVGAAPDAQNPFSARLNKALWAARPTDDGGDGDLRFTFNKQGPAATGSVMFQSGWQGRAEIGLIGDDNLRFKVSADGAHWHEALSIDRNNGRVWFPSGATRRETVVQTASGSVTVPSWARWVEAVCVGGGGAGGQGQAGSSSTERHGGGGGGAGGIGMSVWPVEHLGELTIVVGAGGATSGADGGATTITTYGNVILRGEGGKGGLAGQGGLGGIGNRGMSSGGKPDGYAAVFSSGAGGAGGGLSAANAASSGTAGGVGDPCGIEAYSGGGSQYGGGNGGPCSLPNLGWLGGGGGGGGANASGAGHAGGNAGLYGAGGGGGGAGTSSGGAGGKGSAGVVRLTYVG